MMGWRLGLTATAMGSLVLTGALASCSSDDDTSAGGSGGSTVVPCNEDPWTCPAGQTCWVNEEQTGFECLNSGQGAVGEACVNYLGHPTCADGLACYQLTGDDGGTCSPYCDLGDPEHGCSAGAECNTLAFTLSGGQATAHVCEPPAGAGGSGGIGGTGGTSQGGSGGALGGAGGAAQGGAGGTGG